MLIGVDGNEANVNKKVGVSTYAFNLLHYFRENSSKDCRFIVFLREKPSVDMPCENDFFKYKVVKGLFFWSQIFFPIMLNFEKDIDVVFSPAHYAPRFCRFPNVVTIHDLSYFYYPNEFLKKDLYKLKNWTKLSLEKASKIIAVSKTTKKDILKFYSIPEEKIEVIYNGYEKSQNTKINSVNQTTKPSLLKKKKYLLYVGTLQPRKNLQVLIKAFGAIKKQGNDLKLAITGKKGWLYNDIFKLVSDFGLEKEVIFTDYVTDTELTELYKNALCFILPSLYEGFGIPILEAMSFSCPVISSFASSLPEIGGDACLYFDPTDENDLVDKIKTITENAQLRSELIKKGKERIKIFSWKLCAEKTLSVLKSVAEK
jgi:glycosyltransferase involved in cell wall biosynthesis